MIISIGYRVKSERGIQFRVWANKILKDYLLKGFSFQNQIDQINNKLWQHNQIIEKLIQTTLPPAQGIFYDGQIYDAWVFVSDLIKTAKLFQIRSIR
jgi:hypothetical protein